MTSIRPDGRAGFRQEFALYRSTMDDLEMERGKARHREDEDSGASEEAMRYHSRRSAMIRWVTGLGLIALCAVVILIVYFVMP